MVQEYTVGPAGFRALCARKSGAFLETGSFYPPPAALRLFPLLGVPAHTLHPQGVCSIRKAAKPLTAALPYRCGEFTTLSTASFLFIQPLFYTKSSPTARGPSVSCKLFRFPTIFVEHLRSLCYTGCCNIVYCVPTQDVYKKGGCANGKPCCHHHLRRGILRRW